MASELGHDKRKSMEKKTEVVKRIPSLYDVNSNDNSGIEQWQTLMKILNSQNRNDDEQMFGKEAWIIDTEASNHMTGNLRLLQE